MIEATRGSGRIGVFVPFTNTNLEPDLMLMCPAGVSLHFTRLGGYDEDEIPDQTQMAGLGASDFDEELRLVQGAKPDVVMYGCTSATLAHGPEFDRGLAAKIAKQSGAVCVTAAGALIFSLKQLGISQIAFASPYTSELSAAAMQYLKAEGITTKSFAEWNAKLGNLEQGALKPDQVFDLAKRADGADAEAIVLSCTDMRSVEIINELENTLGKPVITSNQAMMFQAIHAAGLPPPQHMFGKLFECLNK